MTYFNNVKYKLLAYLSDNVQRTILQALHDDIFVHFYDLVTEMQHYILNLETIIKKTEY